MSLSPHPKKVVRLLPMVQSSRTHRTHNPHSIQLSAHKSALTYWLFLNVAFATAILGPHLNVALDVIPDIQNSYPNVALATTTLTQTQP